MAHSFEEPSADELMIVDDGMNAEVEEVRGEPHITLTGTTGRQLTIHADDAPALAALILATWQEIDCECDECTDEDMEVDDDE